MNRKHDQRRGKSQRTNNEPSRSGTPTGSAKRPASSARRGPARKGPKGGAAKADKQGQPTKLRIIGGHHRGRTIKYHGNAYTRPMKDNIRENLFNILGKRVLKGSICYDLFAGTAALAFESVSRGAASVIVVEQSHHAVRYIHETAEILGVQDKMKVLTGDTFRLASTLLRPPLEDTPWVIFLCPPYRMWEDDEDRESLNSIIRLGLTNAPPGSVIVAETESSFDTDKLPPGDWDFREYGIVRLAFLEPAMTCGLGAEDPCL